MSSALDSTTSRVPHSRFDSTWSAAELIPLESLVHHQEQCAHDLPLEEVHLMFRESGADYFGLVREERVTGICSRARVGFLLGSRFGFALNSRSPAHEAQVAHPLVFTRSTSVRKILDRALSRPADEFHEDVMLVDDESRLIGLIPTQVLARLQTRLVDEQIEALREGHETERRQNLELFQSNQALRQTQALYRELFESNATGVVLFDVLGRVQAHNRRLAEILGRMPGGSETFSLTELLREDDRPGFEQWLSDHENGRATSGAREFHFELGLKGTRVLRLSAGYIQETSQISGCIEDVTAQRVMEQHLQKQEKQEMLDTLVGGIAHELNNKITPVMGFAQLLELEVGERGRGYLGYIIKSTDEAAQIIRQLLQLSKPRMGKPEAVNLEAVVAEVVAMLKFQIREANAEVHTSSSPGPIKVFADPAHLKQVVMNLAINALHAMDRTPQPRLEIRIERNGTDGWVEVIDNGTGIPTAIIGRIFDPFFTTKGPDKGSGLGLSICSSLLRQQGGDLTVTSVEGQGARFRVRLPLVAGDVISDTQLPRLAPADSAVPARPGLSVLVVEDEALVRHFLQEALRTGFGCKVDIAIDGADGLRRAVDKDYALIVSDVRMPELNGPEFYRKLTTLRPATKARFVFVTGHEGETSLGKLLEHSSVPVLRKPFTMKDLQEICGRILNAHDLPV